MGVETNGYLNSKVSAIDLFKFIKENINENAINYMKYEEGNCREGYVGSICFEYQNPITQEVEKRNLFVIENLECESWEYGKMFEDNKHLYLSLGRWGESINIMRMILSHFGGFLDENNCDDIEAWETYIQPIDIDEISEHILKRNEISEIMDKSIPNSMRYNLASWMINNSDKVKDLL